MMAIGYWLLECSENNPKKHSFIKPYSIFHIPYSTWPEVTL